MKPSREELMSVVRKTIVPHTAFARGRERLQEAWETHQSADVGGIPILAESRLGKSSLCNEFKQKHPKVRNADGLQAPVLSVRMPTAPTLKGLCEQILTALEDPQAHKGTQSGLESRSRELSKRCGVKMLIIEEFHQVFNPTRGAHMYTFGEFLKNYSEESGALLVPVGLPHAEFALKHNEQLNGRMKSPIRLPRFDWNNADAKEEFVAILQAMHRSLGRFFKMPEIGTERIAFLFFCATGGIIGYMAKILDQAVRSAALKNSTRITLEDLACAHENCMDPMDFVVRGISPFAKGFQPKIDDVFMARVMRVGVRPEEAPGVPVREGRGKKNLVLVSA
jgi:hypothetical protein